MEFIRSIAFICLCAPIYVALAVTSELPPVATLSISVVSVAILFGSVSLQEVIGYGIKLAIVATMLYFAITFRMSPHTPSAAAAAAGAGAGAGAGTPDLTKIQAALVAMDPSALLGPVHSLGRLVVAQAAGLFRLIGQVEREPSESAAAG